MSARRAVVAIAQQVMLCCTLLVCTTSMSDAGDLPVPRITVYPGDILRDEHVIEQRFARTAMPRIAVYETREAIVGKVARRTLLPGQPVPVNAVREPDTISQGKSVLIVFQAGGLTITTQAIPLQSGGIGDLVSLRNPDSGTTVKGIVQADGTVRVAAQ